MVTRKTSLLILSILLVSGSLALLLYQDKGQAFAKNPAKMRVLRVKDKTKQGPTAGEIKAFRDTSRKALEKGQDGTSPQPKAKRLLEDQIPKHVPIKIKIRKEKEEGFQNRDDESWIRHFELEVKNTGNKPIYYLSLVFNLPEIKAPDGNRYGTSLHYGRSALVAFSEPLKPTDTPIKPGETHVFALSEMEMGGWESFSQEEHKGRPQPPRVEITLDLLNFGDGTGYQGQTGVPRKVPKKQASIPTSFRENGTASQSR